MRKHVLLSLVIGIGIALTACGNSQGAANMDNGAKADANTQESQGASEQKFEGLLMDTKVPGFIKLEKAEKDKLPTRFVYGANEEKAYGSIVIEEIPISKDFPLHKSSEVTANLPEYLKSQNIAQEISGKVLGPYTGDDHVSYFRSENKAKIGEKTVPVVTYAFYYKPDRNGSPAMILLHYYCVDDADLANADTKVMPILKNVEFKENADLDGFRKAYDEFLAQKSKS